MLLSKWGHSSTVAASAFEKESKGSKTLVAGSDVSRFLARVYVNEVYKFAAAETAISLLRGHEHYRVVISVA